MGGFITTRSAVNRHGVFAEERQPAPVIEASGTGVVGLVGRFPWGPDDQVIIPADPSDRGLILAPVGMARTGSGWLAVSSKAWSDLRIVRALGAGATRAEADLESGADTILTLVAKWKGSEGNNIDAIVEAASDADVNHFNLKVVVSNAGGSTEDIFENLNYSAVGSLVPANVSQARLVGSVTVGVPGRPLNGTYSMLGGTDGTINAGRYVGTLGAPDHGLSLFENDLDVNIVLADDCGDTDRAAVNTGIQLHAQALGERIGVINGNSGLSLAAVQTAVALNRSARLAFADGWYFQFDGDGVERLCSPAPLLASVMANLSPSTSPAWKGSRVQELLACIVRLQSPRGTVAGILTKAGVCTIIREQAGGYTFEAGILTCAPSEPAKKRITRTRIGDHIARSVTPGLRPLNDAPNVRLLRQEAISTVDRFLAGLKDNAERDPIGLPHVLDYWWGDFAEFNPVAELAAGDFTLPVNAQTSAGMERIFLSMKFGENVFRITAT